MKINAVVPTRGLIFTEVVTSIGDVEQVIFSHDLTIPEAHNRLTKAALSDKPDYILFIEEDTVLPRGGLQLLLKENADIACIDYAVGGWGCVTKNQWGDILWCGLGSTLIRREVFEALPYPWFRSDKQLRLNDYTWIDAPVNSYGGQDIWFCLQARKAGFKIKQVEGVEARHLKLDRLGTAEINHGLHEISPKQPIIKNQIITVPDGVVL